MVAVFAVVELRAGAPSPRVILVVEVAFAARKGWIIKAVGAFFLAIKANPLATVIALAADFVPAVWTAADLTAVGEVRILLPRGPLGEGEYGPGWFILLVIRLLLHLYVQQAVFWLRLRRLAEL